MEYSSTTLIAVTVILVLVAALFVWLSLTMAAAEGAVARVTRASLNNLILEVQTDSEASQFLKMKKIDKIHRVQRLIADRYATAGSCAFFRIACNVLDGVLVSSIASLWGAELWVELLAGFLFAIIVAVVSVLVRPRTAGMTKPVDIMISNSRIVSLATKLTPFARIGGDKSGSKGPGRRSRTPICPMTRSLRRFSSSRARPPSTDWWSPTTSIRKSPKCCATCSPCLIR